jgi:hypothetical protein
MSPIWVFRYGSLILNLCPRRPPLSQSQLPTQAARLRIRRCAWAWARGRVGRGVPTCDRLSGRSDGIRQAGPASAPTRPRSAHLRLPHETKSVCHCTSVREISSYTVVPFRQFAHAVP